MEGDGCVHQDDDQGEEHEQRCLAQHRDQVDAGAEHPEEDVEQQHPEREVSLQRLHLPACQVGDGDGDEGDGEDRETRLPRQVRQADADRANRQAQPEGQPHVGQIGAVGGRCPFRLDGRRVRRRCGFVPTRKPGEGGHQRQQHQVRKRHARFRPEHNREAGGILQSDHLRDGHEVHASSRVAARDHGGGLGADVAHGHQEVSGNDTQHRAPGSDQEREQQAARFRDDHAQVRLEQQQRMDAITKYSETKE